MTEREEILEKAGSDLVYRCDDGRTDGYLWEHSRRVARTARQITAMPFMEGADIDLEAIAVASLYHEAGWAYQVKQGEVAAREVLSRPTSDIQREIAAAVMTESLTGVVYVPSLELAQDLIRQLNYRHDVCLEAQIVADADNLDEFGYLGFWHMVRRHCLECKGISDALKTWQTQRQFRYWEARINNSFYFEQIKQIAKQRLEQLDQAMTDLAEQHDRREGGR